MRRSLSWSLLASSLALAAPASAAEPARETKGEMTRAEAEKRLNEGLRRYARGEYEAARMAFAEAYAVYSSIDLLFDLARAEVKSGHPLEAIQHARQILRDPTATDDDRTKAQKVLDDANGATGHIQVEAPDGTSIVIDEVPTGECPFKEALDVAPGKHVILARAGGDVKRVEIDLGSGETVTARFDLGGSPAAGRPPAGDTRRDPPRSGARTTVPLVLGGAALVAAGVGVVFGLEGKSHESDAADFRASHPAGFCFDRTSAACGQYQSLLDSQQQATNIERVAFVAGGVLAVGAVATWALWPRPRAEAGTAWVAPVPGGVRAGISF